MTTQAVGRPRSLPLTQLLGGIAVALLSAAAWFAWMGWDGEYQVDPLTQEASGPYEVWQVAGCVASLLVVLVGALLLRVRWFVAAPAMTVAFTAAWTVTAAASDGSGLFLVGAVLVFMGLAVGTTVVSLLVLALRRRARPGRSTRP
ncbi:hypothetical protein Dvina_01310 [Dactylosporangium vinaceum]|uniref:Integral membrane protein n=1 Tax=Dactylosporangium vinaceum TaxID=53362 RepID=A0ABV5MLQ6_9ACTN|nr:hypothetical protein [Dactylosporangium vinaceum]UAB96896.1 hypothetical protein Dvina_01310 [Dactylosporangium vinaceum]